MYIHLVRKTSTLNILVVHISNIDTSYVGFIKHAQTTRRQIHDLEDQNNLLLSGKHKLESQNQALELERKALLNAITKFRQFVPEEILSSEEFGDFASLNPRSTDADHNRTDNCCHRVNATISEVTEDVSHLTFHPMTDGRLV